MSGPQHQWYEEKSACCCFLGLNLGHLVHSQVPCYLSHLIIIIIILLLLLSIMSHRFNGSGKHFIPLTRLNVPSSCNLWLELRKCHSRVLLLWKELMVFRSFRFIVMSVQQTVCLPRTRGKFTNNHLNISMALLLNILSSGTCQTPTNRIFFFFVKYSKTCLKWKSLVPEILSV